MSPYNHFYLREAMNRGDPEAIYKQISEIDEKSEGAKEKIEELTR